MTSRVISDPSALGWEYDPDTGRWTWGGNASSGGGGDFPEAPVDGNQYGRQDAGWTQIVSGGGGGNDPRITDQNIANWDASFGWGDHGDAGYLTAETDPTVPDHVKNISVDDINNWNAGGGDYTGADAVKLTGDQSVAGHKTWTGVATFGDTVTMRGTLNGDDTANFQNAVTAGSFVKSGGTSSEYLMADGSVSTGSTGGGGGFSGDYNDLTNKPTIPTNNNQLTNGAGYITAASLSGYATQTWVSTNYQPKGSYLSAADLNGYATQTWCAQNFVSNTTISGYYTKTEADAKFELKGAGGGGAFVPLSGNSTINGILTATDFVATSDRNKKDHIETAPTGVIEKLRGVTFQWKDTGKESAGVVAQELQDAGLGHLVHEDDDGLSVAYAGLTAYLIEEVKALRKELEALKGD